MFKFGLCLALVHDRIWMLHITAIWIILQVNVIVYISSRIHMTHLHMFFFLQAVGMSMNLYVMQNELVWGVGQLCFENSRIQALDGTRVYRSLVGLVTKSS